MMDLHTHLDLYPDALELAHKVNDANSFTLCVTTSPRAWEATSRVFSQFSNINVALGLHPENVSRKYGERDLLLRYISSVGYVGEIGLDGLSQSMSSRILQKQIFENVLSETSRVGGRILSIHSRRAVSEVLSVLGTYPRAGIPILHWFSGAFSELRDAINLGCLFSVNTLMATSEKGAKLISLMPHDRVLPESDGPFAVHKGKPLSPIGSNDVAQCLSRIWKVSQDDVQIGFEKTLREVQLSIP